jgi:exodeoxyribonuclease VII small subunit
LIPARRAVAFSRHGANPIASKQSRGGIIAGGEPSRVAEFEHSLDELEQLVQHGRRDLSLDDSLKTYERGIALYRNCQTALEQAELRVKLLYDPEAPDEAEDFKPDTP